LKKTTLKDIAKNAGVSAATVSYVLNNVANQTIPEDTRCRVLEAAKQLNYVPNLAARSLVKQKSGLIGILINRSENEAFWNNLRYASLINELERKLTERGFHVILSTLEPSSPKLDIIAERKLDGVFVIDVRYDKFHLISSLFTIGVPLIVIDSLIDDPLFYKIVYDFEAAFAQINSTIANDDRYLVLEHYNNLELLRSIQSLSSIAPDRIHIMKNEQELELFLVKQEGRSGIIINEFISAAAAKYVDASKLTVICTADCPDIVPAGASIIQFGKRKSEAALDLMLHLLQKPAAGPSCKYIKIEAE